MDVNRYRQDFPILQKDIGGMPVVYFTQMMAMALGLAPEVCCFDIHFVDPRPLFAKRS